MRRRRLLLTLAALVALLLVAAAGVATLLSYRGLSGRRLATLLSERTGLDVQVGGVTLGWLPPRLIASGVEAPPALRAARLDVQVSLPALLRGEVALRSVHLKDVSLALLVGGPEHLAFDTGEPVGKPLGGGGGGPPDLGALPEIHVDEGVVTLRDAEARRETLRLEIAHLDLDRTPLLGSATLALDAGLGPGGRHGSLQLHARADALAGLGSGGESEPSLRVALEARRLEPLSLAPWLPAQWPVAVGEGALDLTLRAEGRRADGFRTQLALDAGQLRVGPLGIRGPARLEGRLDRDEAGFTLEQGRFQAASARTAWAQARQLDAQVAFRRGQLEIGTLALEDVQPRGELAEPAASLGVDVRVERAGQLSLQGLQLGHGPTSGIPQAVEARDLTLVVEPAAENGVHGLPLEIAHLGLSGLVPGGTAQLRLDARGGTGVGGRLQGTARFGPWSPDAPLPSQPLALDLTLRGMRAEALAALLPAAWKLEVDAATQLDATLRLEGPRALALAGPVSLALSEGSLSVDAIGLGAPARLEGRLAWTESHAPTLDDATLQATGVSWDGTSARDLHVSGAWAAEGLHLDHATAESLRSDPPRRLPLGDDFALEVQRAEHLALTGLDWPTEGSGAEWPQRVEATNADLQATLGLRHDAPPLPVQLGELQLEREDGQVRLALRGRGGEGDAGLGTFRTNATLRVGGDRERALAAVQRFELELPDADAAAVAAQLPSGLAPEEAHGRLSLSMALSRPSPDARASGRLQLALRDGGLVIAPIHVEAPAQAEVGLGVRADGVVEVDDVSLEADGGRWMQRGRLVLEDPPRLDATLAVENVALYRVLAIGDPNAPTTAPPLASPTATVSMALQGPLGEGEHRFDALQGRGSLLVEGGQLRSSALLASVARALGRELGLSTGRGEGRRVRLERASATLQLGDGALHTKDLHVRSEDWVLRGSGRLSLSGDLRLDTELTLLPTGVTRLFGFLNVTRPLVGDVFAVPRIPVAVRGSLADPEYRPEPSRLPLAWARGLLHLPGRALGGIKDTGRSVGKGIGRMIGIGREKEPTDTTDEAGPGAEPAPAPTGPASDAADAPPPTTDAPPPATD